MLTLGTTEPLAVEVTAAVRTGDVDTLRRLLAAHPELAGAAIGTDGGGGGGGEARPLLHVATDWPGHLPRVAETIGVLVAAGAPVDGRFRGPHAETALHWAASCDDVAAVDALLDAGADVDAPGAVIAGGTPLQDARAFRCWAAAARLVERGARVDLHDAATLGMTERVAALLDAPGGVSRGDLGSAFWSACHGGRLETAQLLAARGAGLDVVAPWEATTPLDAAGEAGAHALVTWLRERGAHTSHELRG